MQFLSKFISNIMANINIFLANAKAKRQRNSINIASRPAVLFQEETRWRCLAR